MSFHLKSPAEVVAAYGSLRSRVVDLARSCAEADGDLPVPHCPSWTVRELLSHMVGVPEDVLAGRLDGVASDPWTQAQVERHRGSTLAALADAWEATAEAFDQVLAVMPEPVNSQVVLDATSHEHDLRLALARPGARDADSVGVALGWVLRLADDRAPDTAERLRSFGVADFDLVRACTGRRSAAQISALGIDLTVVETLLAGTPLRLPPVDVDE